MGNHEDIGLFKTQEQNGDNMKTDVKEDIWLDWSNLAENRDKWLAVMYMEINFLVP